MAENLRFNLEVDTREGVQAFNDFFAAFEQGAAQAKSKLNTALGQGLQTEIRIELKGGELVARTVQSVKQESSRLADIYKAVNGEIGKTPNELNKQLSTLKALQGDIQKYETGTRNVTGAWTAISERIRAVKTELDAVTKDKLEIKIELVGGKLVAETLQTAVKEETKLQQITKALNGELGKTPAELNKQLAILRSLQTETKKYENGTRLVTGEWKALEARIRTVKGELDLITKGNLFERLAASVKGLGGQFALVQTLSNGLQQALQGIVSGTADFLKTGERINLLQKELVAFTGSSAAAEKAFKGFQDVAVKTKFNVEQVAAAGKTLLAFGVSTEEAAKATGQLAVIASATNSDIGLLARNLGQIATQGRAYTRDLQQFATAGIPIWNELAIVTGKTTAELKKLAEEGAIGYAEVSQALTNMSKEGSAFAIIAEEVQDTFTGALESVVSGIQNLAGEFVKNATEIDKAFGSPIIGALKLIAAALNALADNWKTIATVVTAAAVAVAGFYAALAVGAAITFATNLANIVASLGGFINFMRILIPFLVQWANIQKIIAAGQALVLALSGNWIQLAAGLAAGTAAAIGINNALNDQAAKADAASAAAGSLSGKIGQLTDAEIKLAQAQAGNGVNLGEKYKALLEVQGVYKANLDAEIAKLVELKKAVNDKFDAEKENLKTAAEAVKTKLQAEKDNLATVKDALKDKFDSEKSQLQETLDLVKQRYDEEIGRLEALTPAEQALAELRRQELVDKLASGKLTEKEALETRAQLERMDAQNKIRDLRIEKEKESERIQAEMAAKEKEYKENIDAVTAASEGRQNQLKAEITEIETQVRNIEQAQKDYNAKIDETITGQKNLSQTTRDLIGETNKQIAAVNSARSDYDRLTSSILDYEKALRAAAAAQRDLNNAKAGGANRFTGGPVTGGTKYTVNEAGKEAFLAASGKLSMINAPSWGQWRAPSSGTVIPAHLTSKLDIPRTGININTAAINASGRVENQGGLTRRLIGAINSTQNGNVHNNVTIQSTNTTKTASDILVELTKIKRRRYS